LTQDTEFKRKTGGVEKTEKKLLHLFGGKRLHFFGFLKQPKSWPCEW